MSGKWRLEIAGLENEKQREAHTGVELFEAVDQRGGVLLGTGIAPGET